MKSLIVLVSAFAVSLALPHSVLHNKWAEYKLKYNKQYPSLSEEIKRLAIFADNTAQIEAHNIKYKNGEVSYSKGINKFGDLTAEEFLGQVTSYKWRNTTVPGVPQRMHVPSGVEAADEVDWRTKNAVTEVGTEGDCAASWAFSALGSVEGQLALKTNKLVALSAQNLVDCSDDFGNAGCDGGLTNSAFDYIQTNGIESAVDYPYEASSGSCQFDASKSVTKISGYTNVASDSEASLQDAVANVGPISSAIHVSEELQFYYGGVYLENKCLSAPTDLNLGVVVVGYGKELLYEFWTLKNSWGPDWGEEGYIRLARNYGNNCGVSTAAGYPNL